MTLKAKHYNRILVIIGLLLVFTIPVFADDYETTIPAFNYGSYTVPAYDGDPSEAVNGNLPAFSSEELNAAPYVYYGDLDIELCTAMVAYGYSLQRCGMRPLRGTDRRISGL